MNIMNEEITSNKVYLCGHIVGEPVYSHEVWGEGFYDASLSVKRLSGQDDIIPLTVSERLLIGRSSADGNAVALNGQFRSYNKIEDGKSRLILTVFVREFIEAEESRNPNTVELHGYVCKPPIFRVTPFKREICDILIAVNRAYNKSDYIPCIAWGRNARYAGNFAVGDRVEVAGRIQSRDYQKFVGEQAVKKTAFEVSIGKILSDNGYIDINQ
ncbi:MAG: single-stranded DNA-binding protein [Clostridiaceae bacterium]|jgi:single-stranded DNA-binding protein|nr:single-stranded DNA-binding protein [Clostridiaceae bacterium]